MKRLSHLLSATTVFAMVLSVFASSRPVLAQAPHVASADDFVPGEVVVGFAKGQTPQAYAASASALASGVSAQVASVQGNLALLSFDPGADVNGLVGQLQGKAGVVFAEPNFVLSIPEKVTAASHSSAPFKNYVLRRSPQASRINKNNPASARAPQTGGKNLVATSVNSLLAMKTIGPGNRIMATYPNDTYIAGQLAGSWSWVGADIVWPNATASAGICEIDTGVDYLHPDLVGKVLKGKDFVNDDLDPMDDNGHGTHVAGIMVALKNNAKGISGVSTGTVLAVKALDSQGSGTSFDIATAIYYCANTATIKVINMSLGASDNSTAIRNAIDYAVNLLPAASRKLIVAAAGNGGSDLIGDDIPEYPAFYGNSDVNGSADCAPSCEIFTGADGSHPNLAGKVLAVAASGDNSDDYSYIAPYSNYGSWISVVAPGTDIFSTLPYDKPFWLGFNHGFETRYDFMSGTSMATPYVSAIAARRWGYKPLETNAQVATAVINSGGSGFDVTADDTFFPTSMAGKRFANVAAVLDRGAAYGYAYDASTGLPLDGATIQVYKYPATLISSSVITPSTVKNPLDVDPTRVYTDYNDYADVLNIPVDFTFGYNFFAKVSKLNYTASPQDAFGYYNNVFPGSWTYLGTGFVPPKSTNFDFVTRWYANYRDDQVTTFPDTNQPFDLDTDMWLPAAPNGLDISQPASFIIGMEGNDFGFLEGYPTGTLSGFPFGRMKREGGFVDDVQVEDITISSRKAHAPLAANPALPYYPGTYSPMITDYGQTIDNDGDACGDNYGAYPNYDPGYDPTADTDCYTGGVTLVGTLGIPLMGVYYTPTAYIWKDGVIKASSWLNGGAQVDPGDSCSAHFWNPFTFSSGVAGVVTYSYTDVCGDGSISPYSFSPFSPHGK